MYGTLPLDSILGELSKINASSIDIWPRIHANHREQIDKLGWDKTKELLAQHGTSISVVTRYDLGPLKINKDYEFASYFNAKFMVCGGAGPKNLKGENLKMAIRSFIKKMEPNLHLAREQGIQIAIENHSNNLINSPDSLKWLVDIAHKQKTPIKVALAPYHLESLGLRADSISNLILQLGENIGVFYAWQHGMGCHTVMPKHQELLQMPGRGALDFQKLIQALIKVKFSGLTSIFMHPVPRGIPILPSKHLVTHEIQQARGFLENLY